MKFVTIVVTIVMPIAIVESVTISLAVLLKQIVLVRVMREVMLNGVVELRLHLLQMCVMLAVITVMPIVYVVIVIPKQGATLKPNVWARVMPVVMLNGVAVVFLHPPLLLPLLPYPHPL
jgi:membrane-associated HD superfamily phosphohydrolase